MAKRIPAIILAATGSVGQRFVQLLDNHPWFEVVGLTGSERTVGRHYSEVCHWVLPTSMPHWAQEMRMLPSAPDGLTVRLAFSALPADTARHVEARFAEAGVMVCSNASAFRQDPLVPILLPEVNPDHIEILPVQREKRGWAGGIVTNPNCTSTGATVALKAIQDAFGLRKVFAVSLQALSGAGYPGVASLDSLDNVIPYIGGEEEKVESEPRKMLGYTNEGGIHPANFIISAHTNRVAVSDGHMVCLTVEMAEAAPVEAVNAALSSYQSPEISRTLPSAPHPVIMVRPEPDRPQPRLDRMTGAGMTTVVGRLRPDPLFHVKLVVLSHNTIRGAAGGSILNAELLYQAGFLE